MEAQEFSEPGSGMKIDVFEGQSSAPLIEHVTAIAGTNAVALGRPERWIIPEERRVEGNVAVDGVRSDGDAGVARVEVHGLRSCDDDRARVRCERRERIEQHSPSRHVAGVNAHPIGVMLTRSPADHSR